MVYNFIICEDNAVFMDKYLTIIHKIQKDMGIEAVIHTFENYCEELKELIYSDLENKIYILDLMLLDVKGNDIARIIRSVDLVSLIIFITSYYNAFSVDIVSGEYVYLKYIDKLKNYEEELYVTLTNTIGKIQNIQVLQIELKDKIYNIVPKDINYVYTEDRKIIIKTIHGYTLNIPTTLKVIKSRLPNYFMFSKNCCLVNIKRIVEVDKINRVIFFDNFSYTNLVSRKYLKQIISEIKKGASHKD